jgi:hypothetical protein
MSKAKFTPGPWRVVKGEVVGSDGKRVVLVPDGFSIGSVCGHPERSANLALCIAAPEMYEALKACRNVLVVGEGYAPQVHPIIDQIDTIIAKAEGRQ